MNGIMYKIKPGRVNGINVIEFSFWCPGCRHSHEFLMGDYKREVPDGVYEPKGSVVQLELDEFSIPEPLSTSDGANVCLVRVEKNMLIYSSECSHRYAGHVIPVPDFPS